MTHDDLANRLDHAVQITKEAAQVSMRYFRALEGFETKADQSPVTIADEHTEGVMRAMLEKAFPGEPIFGEETGRTGEGDSTWIIDPIDGTRSFIAGLPLFGMLLGYLVQGTPALGVIRMPGLAEVYAGVPGIGASFNGNPIRVSACRSVDQARLFINEADKLAVQEPQAFGRLVRAGQLRRMGSDCYPHALVAAGSMDAVVDFDLQPYDYLPVSAVVTAAGGLMTDWQGNPLGLESDGRTLTAATPQLHAELVELVNRPD